MVLLLKPGKFKYGHVNILNYVLQYGKYRTYESTLRAISKTPLRGTTHKTYLLPPPTCGQHTCDPPSLKNLGTHFYGPKATTLLHLEIPTSSSVSGQRTTIIEYRDSSRVCEALVQIQKTRKKDNKKKNIWNHLSGVQVTNPLWEMTYKAWLRTAALPSHGPRKNKMPIHAWHVTLS